MLSNRRIPSLHKNHCRQENHSLGIERVRSRADRNNLYPESLRITYDVCGAPICAPKKSICESCSNYSCCTTHLYPNPTRIWSIEKQQFPSILLSFRPPFECLRLHRSSQFRQAPRWPNGSRDSSLENMATIVLGSQFGDEGTNTGFGHP